MFGCRRPAHEQWDGVRDGDVGGGGEPSVRCENTGVKNFSIPLVSYRATRSEPAESYYYGRAYTRMLFSTVVVVVVVVYYRY